MIICMYLKISLLNESLTVFKYLLRPGIPEKQATNWYRPLQQGIMLQYAWP